MRVTNLKVAVLGDMPEAQRIREVLQKLGIVTVDISDAYRLSSHAAVYLSDQPLARRTRRNRLRSVRICRVKRTAMELRQDGMYDAPSCLSGALGISVFSIQSVRASQPSALENAIREAMYQCMRFQNQARDRTLQDAASERKKEARRARIVA